ncbi:high-potential iron-sulfur protein [Daejeonella lutea]|uniref:High-potential iron-sulfur protein n=1 Tax=Daejeonella lutea TaxID=572036 RepID=A0A1T5A7I1_9SPHI|nr:high-potential iron-sulfur protein [Daejeonella lutea]SKB30613.1 High potential iron-sulfur protein [Daejeonella lutea]
MKENQDKYSRRYFIGKYFYASTVLLGGGVLLGCTSLKSVANSIPESSPEGASPQTSQDTIKTGEGKVAQQQTAQQKNPCDDLTGVSAEEIEKRKKLAYVTKTPIPDSHCSNCTLYLPPAKDKPCGGCMLFKGPVRPEGYCAYWAPISN